MEVQKNPAAALRRAFQELCVTVHSSQAPTVAVGVSEKSAASSKFEPQARVMSTPSVAASSSGVARGFAPNPAYERSKGLMKSSAKAKPASAQIRKMTPPRGSIAQALMPVQAEATASPATGMADEGKKEDGHQSSVKQEIVEKLQTDENKLAAGESREAPPDGHADVEQEQGVQEQPALAVEEPAKKQQEEDQLPTVAVGEPLLDLLLCFDLLDVAASQNRGQ